MTKAQPKKSLRTFLMLCFVAFSVIPLTFITGFSVVNYKSAIDSEQAKRLESNHREIESILKEFEAELTSKTVEHAADSSLIYNLSQNNIPPVRSQVRKWLSQGISHRISVFARDGRLEVLLYKDINGELKRERSREGGDVYLSEAFLQQVSDVDIYSQVEIKGNQSLDLISFAKVKSKSGKLVGYIEEIIELDKSFLEGLKKRLSLEVFFFTDKGATDMAIKKLPIIASSDDFELYEPRFFLKQAKSDENLELNIRDESFGFKIRPISWGERKLFVGVGASKENSKAVLKNINFAFYSVVGTIIVLLIYLSLVISNIILKPLSNLVDSIQSTKPGEPIKEVDVNTSDSELGILANSYNEMSKRINKTQAELYKKVNELEKANQEIKDTQAKLVHTGKMASLGQLVAGVAHELNNPIGFIYSNMGHLKEYSDNLVKLVETAEKNPDQLASKKKDVEFDYIVEDMPRLIKSCEEGAKRTRDIVLGLRNFSRLEEAKVKKVNIEDSLENTLRLLTGELKNRIEVKKDFGKVPEVMCYPSQLNQVFMNILSNAAQAIDDKGEITLKTWAKDKNVFISIKDTGKGMDEKTVEQIFDPFFTTKTLGRGTGLGLSISYGIIEKHGGEIHVDSKLGAGTEFTINLPINGVSES